MPSWTLGIDVGSTYTVAAVSDGSNVRLVDVDGDKSGRMRSAVWSNEDGIIEVGRAAVDHSVNAPERYEPSVKQVIDDGAILLGGQMVSTVDVLSTVISRVASSARAELDDDSSLRAVLSHPASWGATRTDVLVEAAQKAGLASVELVAEPVAASARSESGRLQSGDWVAVYDFGGGTFDASLLRQENRTLEVVGAPLALDLRGGEEIDQRIIDYLATGPLGRDPDWPNLISPPDLVWRRHAAAFRQVVREAKEDLSTSLVLDMRIPGLDKEVQLARSELEDLVRDDIRSAIELLVGLIESAGITPQDLAAIHLLGGSSRMPLVSEEIWNHFQTRPILDESPETVLVVGATAWRNQPRVKAPRVATGQTFRSRLAFATRTAFWNSGTQCYGYVNVKADDGTVTTIADEPDPGGLELIAADATQRWADKGGFEDLGLESIDWLGGRALQRWFITDDDEQRTHRIERYAVINARAVTGSTGADSPSSLETVVMASGTLDPMRFYQLPFRIDLADGETITERLELVRDRTGHHVTSESYPLEAGSGLAEWSQRRIAGFVALPGYEWKGQTQARMLAAPKNASKLAILDGVVGQVHTFRSVSDGQARQTRIWATTVDGRGYSVIGTLPENERLGFRLLVAHATLMV